MDKFREGSVEAGSLQDRYHVGDSIEDGGISWQIVDYPEPGNYDIALVEDEDGNKKQLDLTTLEIGGEPAPETEDDTF